jgi:hypothetical protein
LRYRSTVALCSYALSGGFYEAFRAGHTLVLTHFVSPINVLNQVPFGIAELLNFQEVNGQAKPYQVKQLVKLIEKYDLQIEE